MAKDNFQGLSAAEKRHLLLEKTEDLFRYRMQLTTGQLGQSHLLKQARRDIARLKTFIKQEEMKLEVETDNNERNKDK